MYARRTNGDGQLKYDDDDIMRMTSHGDFSTANSLFRATEKAEFHSNLMQNSDLRITKYYNSKFFLSNNT